MTVNVSAVPIGTTLRICPTRPATSSRCVTERITALHHPAHIRGPGYQLGSTTSTVAVPLTLRATRNGHTQTSRTTITVPQDIVKGCGNYGGIGHATITADLRLIPSG